MIKSCHNCIKQNICDVASDLPPVPCGEEQWVENKPIVFSLEDSLTIIDLFDYDIEDYDTLRWKVEKFQRMLKLGVYKNVSR